MLQQIKTAAATAQSFVEHQSFEAYKDDYKAVQGLVGYSFEDIDLFVQQVQEFISRPGKCDQ